jgi:hypothetical protein
VVGCSRIEMKERFMPESSHPHDLSPIDPSNSYIGRTFQYVNQCTTPTLLVNGAWIWPRHTADYYHQSLACLDRYLKTGGE